MVEMAKIPVSPFFIPVYLSRHIHKLFLILALPVLPFMVAIELTRKWIARKKESEADYLGLKLMLDAGYDIGKALDVWERMEQKSEELSAMKDEEGKPKYEQDPPEFFSTHPDIKTRIEQMKLWIPELLEERSRSHLVDGDLAGSCIPQTNMTDE